MNIIYTMEECREKVHKPLQNRALHDKSVTIILLIGDTVMINASSVCVESLYALTIHVCEDH